MYLDLALFNHLSGYDTGIAVMEEPRSNCDIPFVDKHLERDALTDPCDLLGLATELIDQPGIRAGLRPDLDRPVG